MNKTKSGSKKTVSLNLTLEEKYSDVQSAFNGVTNLQVRQMYNLHAKAQAALSIKDYQAETYFMSQIQHMITTDPSLEKPMSLLEDALTLTR